MRRSVGLLALAALLGGCSEEPKSYEDCVLAKMRGQEPRMRGFAIKACQRQFRVEVRVDDPGAFGWLHADKGVTIRQVRPVAYRLTWGRFGFSSKPCEQSGDADFKPLGNGAAFDDGVWWAAWKDDVPPACMRAIEVRGFLK